MQRAWQKQGRHGSTLAHKSRRRAVAPPGARMWGSGVRAPAAYPVASARAPGAGRGQETRVRAPDSCHYLVPISIEIVEEFLGGFGDFGVEGEVLAVDLDGG